MITLPFQNVVLKNGFLYDKQMLNENVTINAVYNRFYDTGRVSAFRCTGQKTVQVQSQAAVTPPPARKRDILLPVSIIISALLISLTLWLIF